MSSNTIHIAYTTSRSYISFDAISIHSILYSNPTYKFHFHILGYELEESDIENVSDIIPKNRAQLSIYPMNRLREMLTIDVPKSFPLIAYARLFLASVLPKDINRVLYLDGDTVIRGDVRQLYETDLGDNLVGAIIDPIVNKEYKYRTGIPYDEPYINAGVLLIPLDRWREENIEAKFVEHLVKHNGSVYMFDQGLVNAVCVGRKMLVSPKYDMMTNYMTFNYSYLKKHNTPFYPESVIKEALADPVIIHFTGRIYGRPWEEGCKHPYKDLFIYHKNRTAYRTIPLGRSSVRGIDAVEVLLYHHFPFVFYRIFKSAIFRISNIKKKVCLKG